jgi:hypothetical protein
MELGLNQHGFKAGGDKLRESVRKAKSDLEVTFEILSGGLIFVVGWDDNSPTSQNASGCHTTVTLRTSSPWTHRVRMSPLSPDVPMVFRVTLAETLRSPQADIEDPSNFNKSFCTLFARISSSGRPGWRPFFEWKLWHFLFFKRAPVLFTNSRKTTPPKKKAGTLIRPTFAKLPDGAARLPRNGSGDTWYELQSRLEGSKKTGVQYEILDTPEYRNPRRLPSDVRESLSAPPIQPKAVPHFPQVLRYERQGPLYPAPPTVAPPVRPLTSTLVLDAVHAVRAASGLVPQTKAANAEMERSAVWSQVGLQAAVPQVSPIRGTSSPHMVMMAASPLKRKVSRGAFERCAKRQKASESVGLADPGGEGGRFGRGPLGTEKDRDAARTLIEFNDGQIGATPYFPTPLMGD